MKKHIIAAAIAFATAGAFAQSFTVDVQNQNPDSGANHQKQIGLKVDMPVNKLISVDGLVQTQQTDNSNTLASRVEVGATAKTQLAGPIDVYGRLGLGQKAASGSERFSYHSEEVGLIYNTALPGLKAKVGYRWRDAFTDGRNDKAESTRFAVSYALSKKDTVGVRYDIHRGDSPAHATALFYTRGF